MRIRFLANITWNKLKKEIDMIRASEEGTVELLVAYDILRYLTPKHLYSGISEEISECDIFLYGISGSDRRENAALTKKGMWHCRSDHLQEIVLI